MSNLNEPDNYLKQVIKFAIPIAAGNILQQMYQIVSSIVVGRTCGKSSLAALGVASPIVNLALFFMIGIGLGLTVLLGKYFGIGDEKRYRDIAFTARRGGLVFAVALGVLGIAVTFPILWACQAPPEIQAEAALYLRIIFCGLPLTFLYNYYSSCYLSIGQSRVPFYALAVSSGANILLTLLLVKGLGLAIAGAAVANVAATGTSVAFCHIYTKNKTPLLVLRGDPQPQFVRHFLREIVSYSGAAAIQQSIFIVGRLIVQAGVNLLGVSEIAGYTAACNLESLVIAPCDGIASALASLVAIELGRRNYQKLKKLTFASFKLTMGYAVFVALTLFFGSPVLVPLFLEEVNDVMVATGVEYLRWAVFAYAIIAFPEAFLGFFRGLGEIRTTIWGTTTQIIVRVAMTYWLLFDIGVKAISLAVACGWALMCGVYLIALARYVKKNPQMREA